MKSILLLAISLATLPVGFAEVVKKDYDWTNAGTCAEFTASGTWIQKRDNLELCRASKGSEFSRTNAGTCAEFTPGGVWIQRVDSNFCRSSSGVIKKDYDWTNAGTCAEFSLSGTWIQKIDNLELCRASKGSEFSRTNAGTCAEFTPGGVWIQKVDSAYCY